MIRFEKRLQRGEAVSENMVVCPEAVFQSESYLGDAPGRREFATGASSPPCQNRSGACRDSGPATRYEYINRTAGCTAIQSGLYGLSGLATTQQQLVPRV